MSHTRTSRFLGESRLLLVLAGPIVLSQLGFVLMGLLDTVMAGRAGAVEQAVVGLGVAVWVPVFISLMGVVQALSPIVAHHFGAGDHAAIVHDTQQAVWLAALLGLVPVALLPLADDLLQLSGVEPDLAGKTVLFLQGIVLGLPAALMFRALSFYSASINHTRPLIGLAAVGLVANALLNWLLIYGHWGLPALGGAGCGWASGIGMWLSLLLMGLYTARSHHYEKVRLYRGWSRPEWPTFKRLLQLGLPIGAAHLAEVSAFAGVALMIGSLGAVPIAAHQVGLNFASVVFMLPMGLSTALSIRVGQSLGAQDARSARFISACGLVLGLVIALALVPLLLALRAEIVALYSPDATVQAVAATLLLFAAAWQLADATQVIAIGALRGYKVTMLPMWLMIVAFWAIGIPLGAWLGHRGWPAFELAPLGVYGFWIGLVTALFAAAVSQLWLLHKVARERLHPAG
jgi:MATE family multidrug resistance protein